LDDLNNKGHANVLLIEDNHADIRMIKEIFKEFNTEAMINVVTNGVEALKFLNKEHEYENSTSPNLILLDLNIPLINGFEVLEEIKTDNELKNIPVIVLTTSRAKKDFLKAQELQVDCFITKPLDYDEYKTILQHIEECWLKINLFSE
jgi:FOG: CheY-like receiver